MESARERGEPSADEQIRDAVQYLGEAARVLGPTGTFLYITFGQPHFRRFLLLRPEFGWRLSLDRIGGEGVMEYFIYRLTKVPRSLKIGSSGKA